MFIKKKKENLICSRAKWGFLQWSHKHWKPYNMTSQFWTSFLTAVWVFRWDEVSQQLGMCFCETPGKPSQPCLATPQIPVRRDPACLPNNHPGYQLTARLKVDGSYRVHLAQYQKKVKIAAAEVGFGQRGCSGSIRCMRLTAWKPKSQLQKKNSSSGGWWDLEVLLREME